VFCKNGEVYLQKQSRALKQNAEVQDRIEGDLAAKRLDVRGVNRSGSSEAYPSPCKLNPAGLDQRRPLPRFL
jgi:hypothetical protein